ncbi:hypothetical protein EIP91_001894 [Steccherinum ochraceum]|uniref:Uncharacterized protein n=1 Tax=Steccherinum ochraceum TaxID=92696 RepID=A0A4R0RQF1_9APHY|nr:hypothetical protein EIP91_001894 [Steccherinum ochraceum]
MGAHMIPVTPRSDSFSSWDSRAMTYATSTSSRGSSFGSTIPGIGMVSGRVVKAVGTFALSGVEDASIHSKLLWMTVQLRAERQHIPERLYEDVMEYQRIRLYSKRVHKQAWSIIFMLLEQRRSDLIARTISRWKNKEIKLFLERLQLHRLSMWSPDASKARIELTVYAVPAGRPQPEFQGRCGRLTDGFCDLALAIFKSNSSILHETLGNNAAWDFILLLLERRRLTGIIDAMMAFPTADCRTTFLRELGAFILRSWSTLPDGSQPDLDEILQSSFRSSDKTSLASTPHELTGCCYELFYELLERHPELMFEAFTVEHFAAIQSVPTWATDIPRQPSESFVDSFLECLQESASDDTFLYDNWMLPLRAITFLKFALSTDPTSTLHYLVCALHDAAASSKNPLPLLCFTLHMCLESSYATSLTCEQKLLTALHRLSAEADITDELRQKRTLTGCTMISVALRSRVSLDAMMEEPLKSSLLRWSSHATSLPYIMEIYETLTTMANYAVKRHILDQWLSLFQLSLQSTRPGLSCLSRQPWAYLLSDMVFSQNGSLESSLAWTASQVLFSAISQSSHHWDPLLETLASKSINELHVVLTFVLNNFIRISGRRPTVSDRTKIALARMHADACLHGLTIMNPIDRFVEFMNLFSAQSPTFNFALYQAARFLAQS